MAYTMQHIDETPYVVLSKKEYKSFLLTTSKKFQSLESRLIKTSYVKLKTKQVLVDYFLFTACYKQPFKDTTHGPKKL